jgi:hypothetical protein
LWLLFGDAGLIICGKWGSENPGWLIFVKISTVKKIVLVLSFIIINSLFLIQDLSAQCSICTKTAQQMGDKPAKGMNSGILYLAAAPFIIAGFIYFKVKRHNRTE